MVRFAVMSTLTVKILEENKRMKEALERIAARGCHHDLNPTKLMQLSGDPATQKEYFENEQWWHDYLRSADNSVRDIAKRALTAD